MSTLSVDTANGRPLRARIPRASTLSRQILLFPPAEPEQCLLAGLLRCARCGRMLHVMYGRRGYARYECRQGRGAQE